MAREVIMDTIGAGLLINNQCQTPECCGEKMQDDGGCAEGCCDDFKCSKCGKQVRVEWPD